MSRPSVSVVVPFLGSAAQATELTRRLRELSLGPEDELVIADNTPDGILAAANEQSVAIVDAGDRRSASYARNRGAARARGEWLLFVDADCVLPPDLVDSYFDPAPAGNTGIVAGEIRGSPAQGARLARWARSRRGDWVRNHVESGHLPAGVTANMLVRRQAFEQVGGFRIGGGGDLDLSWRAQESGWRLEYRKEVAVEHRDRETIRELATQGISYGSHERLLRELHGAVVPRVLLARPVARAAGAVAAHLIRARSEAALFSLIDVLWAASMWWGYISGGRWARRGD